jgi:hypothetical protein
MAADFADRVNAQRAILKQVNQIAWPHEALFAISKVAIQRWTSVNRLGEDSEIVKLVQEAGDALLFLANSSQQQISPEYAKRSINVSEVLENLRAALRRLET